MAEAVSDSETSAVKQPPKRRRRILDPSAIVPVPIYSNKVNSSLQLKPAAPVFTGQEIADDGAATDGLWSEFSSRGMETPSVVVTDSDEDEVETKVVDAEKKPELSAVRSPSPPPPESPVKKQSRQVKRKISEINRKLRAVSSLLSPRLQDRSSRRCCDLSSSPCLEQRDDDDIIILDSLCSSSVREIPLKVRCRTDVHKLPVLSTTPLSDVMTQLSIILEVPTPRLLLLREEVELPTGSTIGELGLSIADIIDCVVLAPEDEGGSRSSSITIRLQGKDRNSTQEFSLNKEAALGSVFSQYMSGMPARVQQNICFHFDGLKVSASQTPAQLDMEDGDIIEVWM
ncbi:NFATC2-interacting protein [Aulostomus maculatus]